MKLAAIRPGRRTWLALPILLVACGIALADGVPPTDPTLPFIDHISVGHAACDTCLLPFTCLGDPVPVTVSGLLPPCVSFRGLHEVPTRGLFSRVVAEFVRDTCRANCPDVVVPFSGGTTLSPPPAGFQQVVVSVSIRTCPDTLTVVDTSRVVEGYLVRTDCAPPPIPPDSLARSFAFLRVVPEHPCAGQEVSLQLIKNGCPPCVHLVSFGSPTVGNSVFSGVIDWTPNCLEFACFAETLSAPMGRLAAGTFHVEAPMTVHVLGTAPPDSVIRFRLPLDFQVAQTCGTPPPVPCVVREMESNVPPGQCALTIAPRDTGNVPLLYSSELPMAGVQGTIQVPLPFRLVDIRLAAGLSGLNLFRQRDGLGMRWIVIADTGVTIAPGDRQHLLDATITVDPMIPRGSSAFMTSTITLASDSAGNELPLCNRLTLAIVAIRLCVAPAENPLCDVNHDGHLDVRDLVRMVGCLRHVSGDSTDTTPCVDCDSSGVFDIADIFCCARDILRGPAVPRDSVHSDAGVSVTFDPIENMGNGALLVRLRVRGAHALSAGLLRLDYPGTHWSAGPAVLPLSGVNPVDVDWYPILDNEESGHIYFGALRTGETGGDEFTFDMMMSPRPIPLDAPQGTTPDRLEVVTADLASANGAVVTPMGALPSVVLEPGSTPIGGPLALSPARPNPFNTSTSFVVTLPSSAQVDLAVHDLAGRRVATLAHGTFGAGQRSFTWDGAGAHDGLYFVQLTVNGQVRSSRVALLRNTH